MNKKLLKDYLVITFAITVLFWGGAAVLSQLLNMTVYDLPIRVMHFIGGFSPTIASYISLKRNGHVNSFFHWLKKVFDFKHSLLSYGLVLLFVLIYYLLGCAINGFSIGSPVYMLIVIIPLMLFSGGNEEAGCRMILQPELEKSFNFNIATIITAVIWWIWHLPIFFINGTANSNMNYFLFGIMCLTLSYALATIRKISKGTFPCILTHCLINGVSGVIVFQFSALSCVVTLIVTIIVSLAILALEKSGSKSKY